MEYQDKNDFDGALQNFERCLTLSKSTKNQEQEAECYQKIAAIHEKLGDLPKTI